jgi:hypothetical protein
MEAFMKKSTLFLAGMTALLLSFGLVLAGCGDDSGNPRIPPSGDSDITNPPDPPDTVADAVAAEQYFYDVWGTLSSGQKEAFIEYINESLPGDVSPIENLDDLADYWEDIATNWADIKGELQNFVNEVKAENDTTPGGDGTGVQVYTWNGTKFTEYTGTGSAQDVTRLSN